MLDQIQTKTVYEFDQRLYLTFEEARQAALRADMLSKFQAAVQAWDALARHDAASLDSAALASVKVRVS